MGADETAGLYGPGSVSWQVHRETTVLFSGARALLMHAAHPLVLAGARQTGFYERDAWKRLDRTLKLAYTITFGTRAEALRAADGINRVHRDVHGIDEITGKPYDALDPDLLLWVHAALIDSCLLFERLTVGKLDEAGRDRFHEEQMVGAELLGLPRDRIPPTAAELQEYIEDVVESGDLLITEDSLTVADIIRNPPPGVPWRPALRLVSWWAFGTLPPPLRESYGIRSLPFEGLVLRSTLLATRIVRPAVPVAFRQIAPARLADRRVSP